MALSLKTKTIIVWLCALPALALILTLVTVFSLSILRDQLVRDSVRLAEEQVGILQDDVAALIRQAGAVSAKDLRDLASVRQRVKIFGRDRKEMLTIQITDLTGEVVVLEGNPNYDVSVERIRTPAPILKPIYVGDRKLFDLKVTLSHSKVLHDIQTTSWIMTAQLLGFLVIMIAILAAVSALLWRMFRRHLDMTRRQEQMERMAYVGTLASGLAHEIRNPLNAMGLKLQVLEEDADDPRPESPARMRTSARALRHQIEQLNATLGNFLSFALPRGRETRPFDLCALIREVRDLLQPEVERRGVRWEDDLPEAVPIKGEPAAFQEVVINVILNALQAMESVDGERRLSVRAAREAGGAVTLEIADTGPGILKKDLPRVFEAFYSTKPGGSGFGLAIAKRIVEDHGGTITARNRPEGGAVFIIRIAAKSE